MSNSKNQPDDDTNVHHVPMLDAAALGYPAELAAKLIRKLVALEVRYEHDNECIFGGEGATGPLDEALAALEFGDFSSARGWLQIAIGKALDPVPQTTTGRGAKERYLRAVYQRERALLYARCALHLILPALQGEVVAERLTTIFAPRH